jgi:hypothetical protein
MYSTNEKLRYKCLYQTLWALEALNASEKPCKELNTIEFMKS